MATKKPPATKKSKNAAKKKAATKKSAKRRKTSFSEFEGFPKKGLKFLKDLTKNNDRDWFKAHKTIFDTQVKAPLDAFVADVEEEFGTGKVFRIYRDVRFSKNKDPYKTHAAAVLESQGCVFYVHFEPKELVAGTGYYQMEKDQLQRFYEAIDDPKSGNELVKLVAAAERSGVVVGGEALKNPARGYARDHERGRFLKHKGLTVARHWKKAPWWHTVEAGHNVVDMWREAAKLNAWLIEHVGASQVGKRFVKR